MTDRINEIEHKIHESIKAARALGYSIKDIVWIGESDHECCPLGACVVTQPGGKRATLSPDDDAADVLGVSTQEAWAFAYGFDASDIEDLYRKPAFYREMYALGQKFRKEYVSR